MLVPLDFSLPTELPAFPGPAAMPDIFEPLAAYLVESQLLSEEEALAFAQKASATVYEALAEELVRNGELTKYQQKQIRSILEGQEQRLVFGHYIARQWLGEGGQAIVLKAYHQVLGREDAIKYLKPQILRPLKEKSTTEYRRVFERFRQGVRVAAQLEHPHIVRTYSYDEYDGVHYTAIEYVPGLDLQHYADLTKGIPVEQAVEYVIQAARGLDYAHSRPRPVLHRDVKPSNLLLDEEKQIVKIGDMGLARIVADEQTRSTIRGEVFGSACFMSPEQAEDSYDVDHRADIYSLGCTLYTLLTNRLLYRRETRTLTLLDHLQSPIPSLSEICSAVPSTVDAVFRKMVAKSPDERYQTMSEVIDALESCRRAVPVA